MSGFLNCVTSVEISGYNFSPSENYNPNVYLDKNGRLRSLPISISAPNTENVPTRQQYECIKKRYSNKKHSDNPTKDKLNRIANRFYLSQMETEDVEVYKEMHTNWLAARFESEIQEQHYYEEDLFVLDDLHTDQNTDHKATL